MNQVLIDEWNSVVKGGDNIVVAGDFAWNGHKDTVRYRFIQYLNGNKIFVKGNHDHWLKTAEDKRYMYSKKIYDQMVVLCHYPLRTWRQSNRGSWNLHGHCHGTLEPLKNQLDVGVDVAYKLLGRYRPFSFDEVREIIESNEKNKIIRTG